MKRGRGEEKFEICVCTHTYIYIYQKLDGEPYRSTPISVVRPGLEASLRSAIILLQYCIMARHLCRNSLFLLK